MTETEDLRAENTALKAQVAALKADLETRPRVERSPMLALIDAMPVLVGAISQEGTCEYINPAFRPWVLRSRRDITNGPLLPEIIPSLRPLAEELITTALGGQMVQRDVSLPNSSGEMRDLQITVVPRRFEGTESNGCIWVTQDVTHLRLADDALRASERRLRLATEAAGLGVWDWDLTTGVAVFSDRARMICGAPATGDVRFDMLRGQIHPDDYSRAVDMTRRAADPVLKDKSPYEYRILRPEGGYRWVLAQGEAIFETRDGAEVAVRYIGTIQDITERAMASQRQQLLMHELNHRVKNTLASVQSIAHLTLRSDQNPDQARARLTDRLVALADAHDILTRENWEAADLTDIIAAATGPYDAAGASRFRIEGDQVRVAPQTAVALALCLHELATNAAKYGALSGPEGLVEIAWSVEGDLPRLTLRWRETGGPSVAPPTRTGFGTRLLTRGLSTEFGGDARLVYERSGVVCTIHALLAPQGLLELG